MLSVLAKSYKQTEEAMDKKAKEKEEVLASAGIQSAGCG
jgi:hypothetical protein